MCVDVAIYFKFGFVRIGVWIFIIYFGGGGKCSFEI